MFEIIFYSVFEDISKQKQGKNALQTIKTFLTVTETEKLNKIKILGTIYI